jgi:hypothetical protein
LTLVFSPDPMPAATAKQQQQQQRPLEPLPLNSSNHH